LLIWVSSWGSGANLELDDIGPGVLDAHFDADCLANRRAERGDLLAIAAAPSTETGSPESAVSSTRALIVWSLPTMPKRGASTSSMRRSRLAFMAG